MKLSRLVLFVSILVLPAIGKSQTVKSFTHDSLKFIEELSLFFDMANKQEGKDFIQNEFKKYWIADKNSKHINLTPERREFIYKMANAMMKRKYRPYPEFKNFLKAFMNFYDNKLPEKTFAEWQNCLEKLNEKGNNKQMTMMLEASELLFEGNILFRSVGVEWSSNNGNYVMSYDSVPKVTFAQLDLICAVKNDSAIIYNTSGVFYPTSDTWQGKMGKVNWVRTGLDENTVYAELKKYSISLRQPSYSSDSAIFYNKIYFNKPLVGKLTDKAMVDAKPETAQYPKFDSYTKRYKISGLADGLVDYDGGFTMSGNKFIGSGNKDEDALLIFKRNNKKFLVAASRSFIFKKGRISSETASITMYLDADSIIHPGLQLQLNLEKKELNLIRTDLGISKSPYFNTFHNIDMYVEEIDWKLDSAKMDFKTMIGTTEGVAHFESNNFFSLDRFNSLMGMDELHPLTILKDFSTKNGAIREFSATSLASYMKYELREIQPLLVKLAAEGFIVYDIEDDNIILKERVFDYIWSRAKKKDYDVLDFHSYVKGGTINAVMNLLNYDLKIFGVEKISLSDSQNVFIYPDKRTVVLKKNRNFNFAGYVHAGLFDFYGKDFGFEYDKFKINLNNIDSLRLSVLETIGDGKKITRIKTVVENITGDLLIDDMGNKSGLKSKDYPGYPVFNSKKNAFVFYDKRAIQRGVYSKDNFYFKIDPFQIDSLDNFTKEGLVLDGEFVSGGIFPQFREKLYVMPDYSLGFVRQTPPEGFAMYGNKGTFNATIKLSNKGLQGDGTISYLTSTTHSSDIYFYPDSVNAKADTFHLKEVVKGGKVEYPPVQIDTAYVHYMPKKDYMQIYKVKSPFQMYNNQVKLDGRLDLAPKGLTGKGKLDFNSAEMDANKVTFKNEVFDSDTANFKLKALGESLSAFSTFNVKAHVDLKKREGEFKSNGKGSIVRFDVNKYICYMDQFKWLMDKSEIELTSSNNGKPPPPNQGNSELTFEGPEFISIHPKQDSLRFYAPRARFDLKNFIISAKDVKYINVADARIYPDSGNVTILKDAVMKTLSNAKIIANSVTKYHTLYEVNANVFARKSYSASGKYDYIDENKNKQTIFFSSISVDTTGQTFADADIRDTMKFALSPNFEFIGKVHLRSVNQFLEFDGTAMIQHGCNTITRSWFKFRSQINPQKILIPVSKDLVDGEDRMLASAIMSTVDSNAIYTAFMSKRISRNDVEVLASDGFLFFDKGSREYRIASKEKLTERNLPGQYLSMNANTCMVYGEGKINLGGDLGQVKLTTVGTANHNLVNDSAYFDLMILMNFFFDNGALDKMGDAINAGSTTGTNFDRSVYKKGLNELVGKERGEKLFAEVSLYGKFKKFPDELEKTLFITDLKMRWNPNTKSYLSSGKIGIGNILKTQVNKMVDGYVELKRKRSGDELTIYIEMDAGNWFFFNYTNGLMQSISGKEEFNNIIKELKPEKRQQEVEKGSKPYQFSLSTTTKKDLFIKKMKKQGGDD